MKTGKIIELEKDKYIFNSIGTKKSNLLLHGNYGTKDSEFIILNPVPAGVGWDYK